MAHFSLTTVTRSAFLILLLATPRASATRLHIRHGLRSKLSSSLQEAVALISGAKPATLADYCKDGGVEEGYEENQRVKGNWKDYGSFYPARVTKVNKNGTFDLLYDDGWSEKHVPPENVRHMKGKEGEKKKKMDDAACEVVDELEDVKKKVEEAEREVGLYMTTKEAQKRGVERPRQSQQPRSRGAQGREPPAPAPWFPPPVGLTPTTNSSGLAASPEPAPASAPSNPISQAKKKVLENLRVELKGLDESIRELREEIANNDRLITGEWDDEEDLDDGVLSIDDLIQQFRDRIVERKEELERLKARRRAQDAQLARVGAAPVRLDGIQAHSKEILSDIEEMKDKRDKLEKEDKLDPELGHALDDLIGQGEALGTKVSGMIEAEREAERLKQEAEAARREAAERRRQKRAAAKKAREEMERRLMEEAQKKAAKSEDPDETMREELAHAKKMAEKQEADANARSDEEFEQEEAAVASKEAEAADADDKALQAAEQVRSGLDIVKSGAKGMDTGVHPNGDKWWRYRYEHAFVEGLLAILVSFFIMSWECFVRGLRGWTMASSKLQHEQVFAHQSLYQHWLEQFLIEMVACLLMFLTVWLIGHLGFFDQFPANFEGKKLSLVQVHFGGGHSGLHLPSTGYEYRVLAYEICVILTFTMILYFCLAISVVQAATNKLARWESRERKVPAAMSGGSESSSFGHTVSISGEINELKIFFVKVIAAEDPDAIDVDSFSIFKYLLVAVRGTVDSMLIFSPLMWITTLLTFGVFLFLHAYAHVAFIRIMTFFLVVLTVTLAIMVWAVISVNRASHDRIEGFSGEGFETPETPMRHQKHQSWIIFALMTYSVFFLCYGTARTLLQPWLWELYFNQLLFVAGFSLIMCLVFVFAIAPLIPAYGASLALPPYVDITYVKSLKETLRDDQLRS